MTKGRSYDSAGGDLGAGGWFQDAVIALLAEELSNSSVEVWRIFVVVALMTDCLAVDEVMSGMACVVY